ncbi:hypothetical protein NEMBOFW57_010064 [Staphylotrichum longicolle]|uniref:DSC E3 ubiquitin ligase complex subunit 3 C-terminal domain-containing protein n=1 Tax=Staphylotrichum longicolle TaxID=669026 RepID=A0AAD4HV86_9PEZI|nr:hypothetical protein NEMBOFW57_010064 [Staphylotrichum longicolle]
MASTNRVGGGGSGSTPSSSTSSPTRAPRDTRPLLPRNPSALLFPPAPPPLHITIRFSTALPDLHLDIPSPQQTTVVALKHLIRGRLAADAEAEANSTESPPSSSNQPTPAAQAALARLRFIHNGRILPDASVLSSVLKAPPPPPISHHADPKGKSRADAPPHPQQRHWRRPLRGRPRRRSHPCLRPATSTAIPLPLSLPAPLGATHPASRLQVTTTNLPHPQATTTTTTDNTTTATGTAAAAAARPIGFDRLLAAGLTPPEISTLRSHFRAIHTARFTPDAMPSPDTLRRMEDAWLDNDSQHLPTTTFQDHSGAGGAGGDGDAEGAEAVDDVYGLSAVAGPLIKGMLIGFVFPLGVVGWLGKEDGVWSRRMQVFVVFGVLLSVSVGLVRGLTGGG